MIARDLHLPEDAYSNRFKQSNSPVPAESFLSFLRDEVLVRMPGPIVVFLDEVDALLSSQFRDDFFATLRRAHNLRAEQEAWRRLTFCLLGVATPEELLREPERTPFNVGRGIWLLDLTREEADALLPGLAMLPGGGAPWLAAVLEWTDGHPYFTQRLCQALARGVTSGTDVADHVAVLVQKLIFERKDSMGYAEQRLRERTTRSELYEALQLYRRLLAGGTEPLFRNRVQLELRLAGLAGVRRSGRKLVLATRNRIFAEEYDEAWVRMQERYVRAQLFIVNRSHVWRVGLLTLLFLIVSTGATLYWRLYFRSPPSDTEPQPKIETGMHTAAIEHIATDAQGRFLVTGSRDKTVRIWDLKTQQLASTIRPPIQNSQEGKIFAVAISSEASLVAAAGWTGATWNDSYSIYLFDRASAKMLPSIEGIPDLIYNLKFSVDGTRLAAVLRNGELRVFRVKGRVPEALKQDCKDNATGLDFDGSGRIATSCLDGTVSIYNNELQGIRHVKLEAKPYAVRFSPDGSSIAVGYMDMPKVDVLNGSTLERKFSPNIADITSGELSAVTWAQQGTQLCAGGQWRVGGATKIRCWSNSGQGSFVDVAASEEDISDLVPLTDSGLIFSARDPAWGVLTFRKGIQQRAFLQSRYGVDFRESSILVDSSGEGLQFSYTRKDRHPAVFSLRKNSVTALAAGTATAERSPPITKMPGLIISGWADSDEVKLNGVRLPLSRQEISYGLAIAPSGDWFVLGTARYLRCFDRNGTQLWTSSAPGETHAVNISGDGRTVIAAFNDGTIRWYQAERGSELLAFFPHNDQKRWVAWIPAGYYSSSSGGQELLGWHLNRGSSQAADFQPMSLYAKKFYQPDVISRVLRTARTSAEN